jgi:endonuclease I
MSFLVSARSWTFAFALLVRPVIAQGPPGYYDTVDLSSAQSLRATLHAVIDDHQRFPYTSTSTDTWNILESADQDPANGTRIRDLYRNRSYAKVGGGNNDYDREHLWPRSYGIPDDDGRNYPFTDCHHLFLCDSAYNAARSNKPFQDAGPGTSEYPIEGGTSGVFPGNANWSTGSFTTGRWQVWSDRRGDVARALLYMDIRYEGGVHGVTGFSEPDLILTDDRNLIASRNTGANESVAYMGILSTLLTWNRLDPPDTNERRRNDIVSSFQGNRNPFVDHPEWAAILFGSAWPGSFDVYGMGCIGSTGQFALLFGAGQPLIGQTFNVGLVGVPSLAPAVLNLDVQRRAIDLSAAGLAGCTALVLPVFGVFATANASGSIQLPLGIPASGSLLSTTIHAQWVAIDTNGRGLVLSNGGSLTFGRL